MSGSEGVWSTTAAVLEPGDSVHSSLDCAGSVGVSSELAGCYEATGAWACAENLC